MFDLGPLVGHTPQEQLGPSVREFLHVGLVDCGVFGHLRNILVPRPSGLWDVSDMDPSTYRFFLTIAPSEDAERAALLVRRGRVAVWMAMGSLGVFACVDFLLGSTPLIPILLLKVAQLVTFAWALFAWRRSPSLASVVRTALISTSVVYLASGLWAMLTGDGTAVSLVFLTVAMGCGALLPWGVRAQALSVSIAAVVLVVVQASLVVGPFDAFVHGGRLYEVVAVLIGFVGSIAVTRVVDSGLVAVLRAERAETELSSSRASLSSLFDAEQVYLATFELVGDDYIYIDANAPLARLVGATTPDQLRGVHARDIVPSEKLRLVWLEELRRCARVGCPIRVQGSLPAVDRKIYYEASLSPIEDPSATNPRFGMAAVDITPLKKAESKLRQLNRELEARVTRRTAELEEANRELEAFSYSVSHDLRTPLRSIEGFSSLLETEFASELPDEARDWVERIRAATTGMAHLIDELLALTRVTRSELKLEPVDMSAVFQEQADLLRDVDGTRRVDLKIGDLAQCRGDRRLLALVAGNLLGNAWKYTRDRDLPMIEVGSCDTEWGRAYFVRDNGCGFDMELADGLFRPFFRLHRVDEYEGTGVGLATVLRIVSRHEGRVWAEAEVDQGATFYFTVGAGKPEFSATSEPRDEDLPSGTNGQAAIR